MKIIIPTFERLEWMPPTITMLKELSKLNYNILVITQWPSTYLDELNLPNIRQVSLTSKEYSLQKKIKYIKGLSGILYRIDWQIKKFIAHHRLPKILNSEFQKDDLLWVVNEMTVMLAGTRFLRKYDYLFTIYELHENNYSNRNIIWAAKHAKQVFVPEYCRAHIMQYWYSLEKIPLLIPNKSEICLQSNKSSNRDSIDEAIKRIKEIKLSGKLVIVYMGLITRERPLEPILQAISKSTKFHLVILGRETKYLYELIEKYNSHLSYLGAYLPPLHLQIASFADIGLLVYIPHFREGLNALFCAPNKIWEYTGMKLPILANDIPGLKYQVEYYNLGKCVQFDDDDAILGALAEINTRYKEYAKSAIEYYNMNDIRKLYATIIEQNRV